MGNIIKSINLDLILEGTGVTPTIPANPRAVFGDPDFDQTSDLMIGQKAYNVTDDIWYYRAKTAIYTISHNKVYFIDTYQAVLDGSNSIYITQGGEYFIYDSYSPETSVDIYVDLISPGNKVSITCASQIIYRILPSSKQRITATRNTTYDFISIPKSIVKLPLNPLAPDIVTFYQGAREILGIGGEMQ